MQPVAKTMQWYTAFESVGRHDIDAVCTDAHFLVLIQTSAGQRLTNPRDRFSPVYWSTLCMFDLNRVSALEMYVQFKLFNK